MVVNESGQGAVVLLHWGVAVRTCNSEQRLEAAADQLRLGEVSLLGVREVAHLEC